MQIAIMWGSNLLKKYKPGDIEEVEVIEHNIKFKFKILREATKEEYLNQEFKPPFVAHPNPIGDFWEVQILD